MTNNEHLRVQDIFSYLTDGIRSDELKRLCPEPSQLALLNTEVPHLMPKSVYGFGGDSKCI